MGKYKKRFASGRLAEGDRKETWIRSSLMVICKRNSGRGLVRAEVSKSMKAYKEKVERQEGIPTMKLNV